MNKKEFLEELNRHLLILEDEEQQDILEEYAQHIDMKAESGLSEEEAIRDFGSVKELAAQILEAYHVKAEFSENSVKSSRKLPVKTISFQGTDIRGKIGRFFKKQFTVLHSGTVRFMEIGKTIGRKTAGLIYRPLRWLRSLLHRENQDIFLDTERKRHVKKKSSSVRSGKALPAMRTMGHFITSAIGSCIYGIFRLCLWCIRWCWNLFMMFLVLAGGAFVLGSLFCFGVLLVWLLKGYPLAGLTLILFGSVLCSGAFTCFCASLIRLDKRERKETVELSVEQTEEVQDA